MTLSSLMAQPGTKEVVAAAEPALTTLAQTILGSITILAVTVAALAVWKAISTQDKRAKDAEAFATRIEKAYDKAEKQNTRMIEAFSEMQKTVDALVRAEENNSQLSKEQTLLIRELKQSFETTIRDAVLRRS